MKTKFKDGDVKAKYGYRWTGPNKRPQDKGVPVKGQRLYICLYIVSKIINTLFSLFQVFTLGL